MDVENGVPQETTSNAQPSSVPAESVASASESAAYWRDKYNGLRGYVSTLQRQTEELSKVRDDLSTRLETSTVEAETTLQQLQSQLSEYKRNLEDIQPRYQQLEQQSARIQRELEVGKMIRQQFPQLTGLYDKGALTPVIEKLDGDDLIQHLQTYAEEFDTAGKRSAQSAQRGATPPPPQAQPRQATMSLGEAAQNVSRAMTRHGVGSQQYKDAFDAYQELLLNGAE